MYPNTHPVLGMMSVPMCYYYMGANRPMVYRTKRHIPDVLGVPALQILPHPQIPPPPAPIPLTHTPPEELFAIGTLNKEMYTNSDIYGWGYPGTMYPQYESTGSSDGMSHHHKNLLKTVQDCKTTCEAMTAIISGKHDFHMRRRQLTLLHDCTDICTLTAKCIARRSMFSRNLANFCAFICEICGFECMLFSDLESQNCACVCIACARECRALAYCSS